MNFFLSEKDDVLKDPCDTSPLDSRVTQTLFILVQNLSNISSGLENLLASFRISTMTKQYVVMWP